MPTDYGKQTTQQRIDRLARTADELTAAIRGKDEPALSRRPDGKNWAPKEVICHLRDIEEFFMVRFQGILDDDEPKLFGPTPDRWAEERQYLRNDATQALAAFCKRRDETLALMRGLTPEQWKRGGVNPVRGRFTLDDFLTVMAGHDDNHLDQLTRALEGRA